MKSAIEIVRKLEHVAKVNSPVILTAFGVSGTIATAYLTGRAAYESRGVIEQAEMDRSVETLDTDVEMRYLTTRDKVELVWELYIPAGISCAATVGCIVLATRVGSRRTAALTAAYSLSEKALVEYREKVAEKFGEKKEKSIRDEIAQDRVAKSPPQNTIITGDGTVLCYEMFTGRYFNSDMESLRRATNDINAKLMREMYATLSDFYYILGLPYTTYSSDVGWESDRLLELDFTTVLSEDSKPCIAFDYNYTKHI